MSNDYTLYDTNTRNIDVDHDQIICNKCKIKYNDLFITIIEEQKIKNHYCENCFDLKLLI